MTWLEIFGWFMAFSITTSFFYRKGVRSGIKHALKILELEQNQIEKAMAFMKVLNFMRCLSTWKITKMLNIYRTCEIRQKHINI